MNRVSSKIAWEFIDNGGRRLWIERRSFSYSDHIPERRDKKSRRVYEDRRHRSDRRAPEPHVISMMEEKRKGVDRRSAWT
jgi:hypothetical protein